MGVERQGHRRGRGRQPVPACAAHPSPRRVGCARSLAPATPLHRWYGSGLKPVDGEPQLHGADAHPWAKVWSRRRCESGTYDVDDTDPTTEPVSTLLHETSIAAGCTRQRRVAGIDHRCDDDGQCGRRPVRPNAVLVYVIVPRRSSPELDIDDVRLMEWRRPCEPVPDGLWVPADAVRGRRGHRVTVEQSGCELPPARRFASRYSSRLSITRSGEPATQPALPRRRSNRPGISQANGPIGKATLESSGHHARSPTGKPAEHIARWRSSQVPMTAGDQPDSAIPGRSHASTPRSS